MPPRYAYWTILIDDTPTAFRAREREELQPTLVQLQRKNSNVTMKWFARGKLWASREAERDDFQMQRNAATAPRERRDERGVPAERRGADWRPGGAHKDPRDRFKKKNRPERAWSEKDPATQRDRDKPGYAAKPRGEWRDKPVGPARGDRPWSSKPAGADRDRRPGSSGPGEKRPWSSKPPGEPKPWSGKPAGERKPWQNKPRGDRPWTGKPAPPSDRPWQTKPTGPRAQRKPWVPKPEGFRPGGGQSYGPPKPRGDRPWTAKPPSAGGGKRPWSGKPQDRKPFVPRGPRPGGPPRKRRDDEPDKD